MNEIAVFMFSDRIEAGHALAERLMPYKNVNGVVLAVPKGAVPIGYVVATELGLPLDLILTKKIGHPQNKEYAVGAVSLWGSYVNSSNEVSEEYIERETSRIRGYLKEMQRKFIAGRPPIEIKGKTVIVIDDGVATGNTLLATVNMLKSRHPAKIVIAVPVSSVAAYKKLSGEVDEMISLLLPEYFSGVGAFYDHFEDVPEEQVKYYLDKAHSAMSLMRKEGGKTEVVKF